MASITAASKTGLLIVFVISKSPYF